MLAPQESEQLKNIESMVPSSLLTAKSLREMYHGLREEIARDYEMSARKCIGKGC